MNLLVLGYILLSILFFSIGEWSSKKYVLDHWKGWLVVNLGGYIGSVIPWFAALNQYNVLSVVGLIWSLLSVVSTLIIGLIIFHEPITLCKAIGMALALVAIALMSL